MRDAHLNVREGDLHIVFPAYGLDMRADTMLITPVYTAVNCELCMHIMIVDHAHK